MILTDQLIIARRRADTLWCLACNYDEVDPRVMFVEFSLDNPYDAFYRFQYEQVEHLAAQVQTLLN